MTRLRNVATVDAFRWFRPSAAVDRRWLTEPTSIGAADPRDLRGQRERRHEVVCNVTLRMSEVGPTAVTIGAYPERFADERTRIRLAQGDDSSGIMAIRGRRVEQMYRCIRSADYDSFCCTKINDSQRVA